MSGVWGISGYVRPYFGWLITRSSPWSNRIEVFDRGVPWAMWASVSFVNRENRGLVRMIEGVRPGSCQLGQSAVSSVSMLPYGSYCLRIRPSFDSLVRLDRGFAHSS